MYSVQALLAEGFPHSDIRGSTIARISPRLFAACHVLHRLLAPRHPPNALLMLSNSSNTARAQDQTAQRVPPPARLGQCSAGAGTTHASANFTHFGQIIPPRRPVTEAARADNPSARSDSPSQRTCPAQANGPGGNPVRGKSRTQPRSAPAVPHGDYRIRTGDPLLAKQVLYQLS
jgi:hypothetical protein